MCLGEYARDGYATRAQHSSAPRLVFRRENGQRAPGRILPIGNSGGLVKLMERYKARLTGETVWAKGTMVAPYGLFWGWLVMWELMGRAHIQWGVVLMEEKTFRRIFEKY